MIGCERPEQFPLILKNYFDLVVANSPALSVLVTSAIIAPAPSSAHTISLRSAVQAGSGKKCNQL
jgi:hypothetical protein